MLRMNHQDLSALGLVEQMCRVSLICGCSPVNSEDHKQEPPAHSDETSESQTMQVSTHETTNPHKSIAEKEHELGKAQRGVYPKVLPTRLCCGRFADGGKHVEQK